MSGTTWLSEERAALATDQILDAAGALFAERGVSAVGMADVASAAGCSRATLYRYFENRDALRRAFVHREARRIGAAVAADVEGIADAAERLEVAVLSSLRRVRAEPTIMAWFEAGAAGATAALAQSSEVVEALVEGFLRGADRAEPELRRRARWVVRVIVSLLAVPGDGEDDERGMVRDFLVPVVARADRTTEGSAPPRA